LPYHPAEGKNTICKVDSQSQLCLAVAVTTTTTTTTAAAAAVIIIIINNNVIIMIVIHVAVLYSRVVG